MRFNERRTPFLRTSSHGLRTQHPHTLSPSHPLVDVIEVWSDQSALSNIVVNTTSKILVSWAQSVYLDCGLGNMFGDK